MARRKEPKIPDAILDQLLGGADPKTAFDPNGLLDDLKKALAERALNAEMDHHLANGEAGNSRNGYGKKTVVTDTGKLSLKVPRDRQSSFDPQLIAKNSTSCSGYITHHPGRSSSIVARWSRSSRKRGRGDRVSMAGLPNQMTRENHPTQSRNRPRQSTIAVNPSQEPWSNLQGNESGLTRLGL